MHKQLTNHQVFSACWHLLNRLAHLQNFDCFGWALHLEKLDYDVFFGVACDRHWDLHQRSIVVQYTDVEGINFEMMDTDDRQVKFWEHGVRFFRDPGRDSNLFLFWLNVGFETFLWWDENLSDIVSFGIGFLVVKADFYLICLWIWYNNRSKISPTVSRLQWPHFEMVMGYLGDKLLRPDFLIN